MSAPLRAVIYTRISRDSEARGEGVTRQLGDCQALAERLGYEVVGLFEDNDVSASTASRKPRPRYDAMMEAVRAGQVDVVLAYSLSRLTRRVREFLDLIDLYRETGVLYKTCVSGDPDLSKADGRASAITIATWDQAEAERVAERVRSAAKQHAEEGRYVGPRPFGYQFKADDTGRILTGSQQALVVDPGEAAIIKECVQRVLDGEGLWSIKNDLNERGIPTATGAEWQSQPLRRMLLRWVHAGYRKHQEFQDGKWTGPVRLHEADWQPIIDRATHERVIAKLTDPSRSTNKGDTELKYLLTWLATCGACKKQLVGSKGYEYTVKGYKRVDGSRSPSRQRVYPAKYTCPHAGCHGITRRMDVVDEFVEQHIIALLEAEGVRVLGGNQKAADEARVRVEEIEAQMALVSDQWIDRKITQAQFDRQNARLMAQLEDQQAQLRSARPALGLEEFAGSNAGDAWENATVVKKRAVLKVLIDMADLRIAIDPIGPGAFSAAGANLYEGIRVEWEPAL